METPPDPHPPPDPSPPPDFCKNDPSLRKCGEDTVKDPTSNLPNALSGYLRTQASFMQRTKTLIRLGGYPGWSESSLGAQSIWLVLSCCGSFGHSCTERVCLKLYLISGATHLIFPLFPERRKFIPKFLSVKLLLKICRPPPVPPPPPPPPKTSSKMTPASENAEKSRSKILPQILLMECSN